jgi:hypothetical protein
MNRGSAVDVQHASWFIFYRPGNEEFQATAKNTEIANRSAANQRFSHKIRKAIYYLIRYS